MADGHLKGGCVMSYSAVVMFLCRYSTKVTPLRTHPSTEVAENTDKWVRG